MSGLDEQAARRHLEQKLLPAPARPSPPGMPSCKLLLVVWLVVAVAWLSAMRCAPGLPH